MVFKLCFNPIFDLKHSILDHNITNCIYFLDNSDSIIANPMNSFWFFQLYFQEPQSTYISFHFESSIWEATETPLA